MGDELAEVAVPPDPPDGIGPPLLAALAADPLAAYLGITLQDVPPGYARASMLVQPQLLNTTGTTVTP